MKMVKLRLYFGDIFYTKNKRKNILNLVKKAP
jgi:hypothetical protein